MNANVGRLLVIAPHPYEEVLGCGGTIARMAGQNAYGLPIGGAADSPKEIDLKGVIRGAG